MLLRKIPYLVMVLASALSARAGSVIYNFTLTVAPQPLFPNTTIQLIEPDFLTAGTYSIPPFTLSDGTVSYAFTQLNVGVFSSSTEICFNFGTAAATLNLGSCSASINEGLAPDAFIASTFVSTNIPTAPGTFLGALSEAAFETTAGPDETTNGETTATAQLQITQTPEPATAPVVGSVLLCGTILMVRRRAARRLRTR
jgi:hypothetical protein